MIAVSSGCTTTVGCRATTRPGAVTTMSMGTRAAAVAQAATSEITVHSMPRAAGFTGVASNAAVATSNSSSGEPASADPGDRCSALSGSRAEGSMIVFVQ